MINKPKSNQAPGPAPITAKRRSSAEERARQRKGRRPKFQDNPPAPEIVEKKEALQLLEETSRIAQNENEELTEEMEDSEEEEEVDDDEDAALNTPTNGVHLPSDSNPENGFKRKLETEFEGEDGTKRAKIETEVKTETELLINGEKNGNSDEVTNEASENEHDEDSSNNISSVTLCKQLKEAVKDLDNSESLKSELISKLKSILNEHQEVKLDNPSQVFSDMLENQLSMQSDDKAAMVEELVSTYLEHQGKDIHHETTTDEEEDEIEIPSSELKSEIDSEESESLPPDLLPQVDGVDSSEKDEQESKEDCNDHKELNNENNEECDLTKTAVNVHHFNQKSPTTVADNKSKILSEMENKFAKETQNALKNRPAYRKKSKSETWELSNGSSNSSHTDSQSLLIKEPGELEVAEIMDEMDEEMEQDNDNDENTPMPMISPSSSTSTLKSLRKFRKGNNKFDDHDQDGPPVITKSPNPMNPMLSPPKSSRNARSPPPLTPEMPTPLRIDIPDHYTPSPISSSSFSGGFSRRLVIRTPPAARAGLVTMVSEAVLSKEDAEAAASAVQLSPIIVPFSSKPSSSEDHPSLKIRLPKVGNVQQQSSMPSVASVTNNTPHHKKVPKRRNLHTAVESDGLDTEEDEELKKPVKKKPWLEDEPKTDEELEGGKTTPDSQITSDDR